MSDSSPPGKRMMREFTASDLIRSSIAADRFIWEMLQKRPKETQNSSKALEAARTWARSVQKESMVDRLKGNRYDRGM